MPRMRIIVCPCGWSGPVPFGPIILCPRCGGTDWRVETNSARLKRLRTVAVAGGHCYLCRLRPVKPGTRYCIEKGRLYQASIARKRCQNCGADVRRRKTLLCKRCTLENRKRQRERSRAWIAANLCGLCGKRPLHPGRRVCLDYNKDRHLTLARRHGQKPRNVCSVCTQLGIEGSTDHNRSTHDRWMERLQAPNGGPAGGANPRGASCRKS
jgi:hypothetical protein